MVKVALPRDGMEPVEFDGELIAKQARPDSSLRWPEFRIWRLDAGGYMAQRLGCSVVYHTADTGCLVRSGAQRGSPATVVDLPDAADPCQTCNPPFPDELGDEEKVRFEFPRSTVRRFRTVEQVVKFFTIWRDPDSGDVMARVTKPVQALLEEAAANDEAFAAHPIMREGIMPEGDDSERHDIPGGGQNEGGQDDQEPSGCPAGSAAN